MNLMQEIMKLNSEKYGELQKTSRGAWVCWGEWVIVGKSGGVWWSGAEIWGNGVTGNGGKDGMCTGFLNVGGRQGPYTLSTVVVPAVLATENSPAIPEHTTVETLQTMSPENKAHYESKKEATHLILTRIRDEIYSTIDACKTAQEMNDNQTGQFRSQRIVNVAGARENVGSLVVQQTGIQCFNCKEFGHFAKECKKPKRVKDSAYHKEKMLLCKQAEKGHCEQSESTSNTCLVENDDSDVTPDSPDTREHDIQIDQNAKDTHNDSLAFVYELKQEMHADLKYVEYLEKEIDDLKSDKAKFLNMYDTILQECVSNDVMCTYWHSLSDLDAHTELQCLYLLRPQLRSNQLTDKVVPNNSHVKAKKTKVEDHHRISSISDKTKSVTACNDSLKSRTLNVNAVCATCGKCLIDSNHFACVTKLLLDVNTRTKKPNVAPISTRKPISQAKKSIATPHLEVAFRKSTCFVRDLHGNDLLTGNRGSDLFTISLQESNTSTPICLMAKALPTQAWLWHRRLSHLNFDYINLLSKKDVVIGLPKLKYVKDQLCPSCELNPYIFDFNEIKEMLETFIGHVTSGLVPQRQKALDYDNSDPVPRVQNVSPLADTSVPSQQELDLLFGPLYDELFNAEPKNPTNANAEENNDNQEKNKQLQEHEVVNPFCTPIQEVAKSSSHNISNSNVHTFNQPQVSKYCWIKDHPLEQVHRNPSKPVKTRRQLATDLEFCMFALTLSTTESKNIKEAMADSAWIEAMQEELH
nr:integrase, catalytic region, zinc finger, CCHC-type, peptidase aspartic, catalytic [Tanacetum cinerariifolium]